MANTLLTIDMITREAVRLWKNSNAFIQNVDMQYPPGLRLDRLVYCLTYVAYAHRGGVGAGAGLLAGSGSL